MSGKVFANGLEIACKVSKGKSVAAFPDPCWSPPSPPAGPVVIPYTNTAYAKDVSNASKSVLIKDKPIAQKDKSFFKTSTGNEAATKAFGQGFFSKTLKGKAYFTSWSMNVMVEGYNVARHTDLTTHNHGSSTNTIMWPFVAGADGEGGFCEEDINRAKEACGDGNEEQKKDKGKPKEETWKERHCDDLLVKPSSQSLEAIKNELDDLPSEIKEKVKVEINKLQPGGKDTPVREAGRAEGMTITAKESPCLEARKCLLVPYKDTEKNGESLDESLGHKRGCCPGQTGHHLIPKAWLITDDERPANNSCTKYNHGQAPTVCAEGVTQNHGSHGKIHRATDRQVEKVLKEYQKSIKRMVNDQAPMFENVIAGTASQSPLPMPEGLHSALKKLPENLIRAAKTIKDGRGRKWEKTIDKEIRKAAKKEMRVTTDNAIDMAAEAHQEVAGHCNKDCIVAQLKNYYENPGEGNCSNKLLKPVVEKNPVSSGKTNEVKPRFK